MQAQTWEWELCVADASDPEHAAVGEYLKAQPGVKYVRVENKGISANTNAAAALAQGEYLGLLDHDDVLAPHAVYWMAKPLMRRARTFCTVTRHCLKPRAAPADRSFKPDFAPDYLNCCNYICHFSVFPQVAVSGSGRAGPGL